MRTCLSMSGLDPSFADRRPRELSGGQRQRISIGTALLMDSRLIIADEPVSALDVTVQSQVLRLILRLHNEKKMTILFITHDLNIVRRICRPGGGIVPGRDRRVGTCGGDIPRTGPSLYGTASEFRSGRRYGCVGEGGGRYRRRRSGRFPGMFLLPEMSETLQPLPRGEAGGYDGCCRPYGQVFPADVNFCKNLFLVTFPCF